MNPSVLVALRGLSGVEVSTDSTALENASTDRSYHPASFPDAIATPVTPEATAAIVKLCVAARVPMTVRGAGTGLEGGCIPYHQGVVINTSKLRRFDVDSVNMRAWVGAGISKMELNKMLGKHKLFFGPDPASNPSLGGMASTSGSGMSTLRYGTTRENILALKVVTAEGQIVETRRPVRKASTGLELTQLYVGSEGTLGVIVEICIKLYPIQAFRSGGIVTFTRTADAVATAVSIKMLGGFGCLVRCELMNATMVKAGNKEFDTTLQEVPTLLFELTGNNQNNLDDEFAHIAEICKQHTGLVTYHRTGEALDKVWETRRGCYPASLKYRGLKKEKVLTTDVCVPLSHLSRIVEETEADFASHNIPCILCAHISDGNFHVMIPFQNKEEHTIAHSLETRIVQRALACGGTASGEHGVGVGKVNHLIPEHGREHIVLQRRIKAALDPHDLFNQGKFYPKL